MATTVTRDGAGYYTVSDGQAQVQVLRNPALRGPYKWLALAGWDRYLVTDPLPTKAAAVAQAAAMLAQRWAVAP